MTSSGETEAKALLLQHRRVLGDYGRRLHEAQQFDAARDAIDELNEKIDLDSHRFLVQISDNLVYRQDSPDEGYRQYGTVTATAGWKFIGDKIVPISINPEVQLPHRLKYLGETAMTLALVDSGQGVGISINQSLAMPTLEDIERYGYEVQSDHLVSQVRQMSMGHHIKFDNAPF